MPWWEKQLQCSHRILILHFPCHCTPLRIWIIGKAIFHTFDVYSHLHFLPEHELCFHLLSCTCHKLFLWFFPFFSRFLFIARSSLHALQANNLILLGTFLCIKWFPSKKNKKRVCFMHKSPSLFKYFVDRVRLINWKFGCLKPIYPCRVWIHIT